MHCMTHGMSNACILRSLCSVTRTRSEERREKFCRAGFEKMSTPPRRDPPSAGTPLPLSPNLWRPPRTCDTARQPKSTHDWTRHLQVDLFRQLARGLTHYLVQGGRKEARYRRRKFLDGRARKKRGRGNEFGRQTLSVLASRSARWVLSLCAQGTAGMRCVFSAEDSDKHASTLVCEHMRVRHSERFACMCLRHSETFTSSERP